MMYSPVGSMCISLDWWLLMSWINASCSFGNHTSFFFSVGYNNLGCCSWQIVSEDAFIRKVDNVVRVINEALTDHLEERRPSPFKCCWWMKELTSLKKTQNRLSRRSYRYWHIRDHPSQDQNHIFWWKTFPRFCWQLNDVSHQLHAHSMPHTT